MRESRRIRNALVSTAVVLLLAYGCSEKTSDQIANENKEVPDEVVTDFVTEETDSGRVSWILTAPKADKFNERKIFLMERPQIKFYDDFGNLQTTLNSDKGEYFSTTRDMLAYGNVVVVTVDGDILETDSLRYLNEEDMIVNSSPVKVIRGNSVVTGTGLRADRRLKSVEILKDVKAVLIDEEGEVDG